jgi:two-component system response regulator RegA
MPRKGSSLVPHPLSILLAEDDPLFRRALERDFSKRGCSVRAVASYDDAVQAARDEAPELAVVDLLLADRSGLDLLCELKRIERSIEVVILTGYASIVTAVRAVRLGAASYLPKPAGPEEIFAAIDDAVAEPETAGVYRGPTLAQLEWEHIHKVLADCGGNISEAARRLGLHRRSLQRKLGRFAP